MAQIAVNVRLEVPPGAVAKGATHKTGPKGAGAERGHPQNGR